MDTRQIYSLARGILGFASAIIAVEALRIAWLLIIVAPKMENIIADMLGPGAQLPALTTLVTGYGFELGMGLLFLAFCVIFWMWKNCVRRPGAVFWVAAAVYLTLFLIRSLTSLAGYSPFYEIIKNLSNGWS